MLIKTRDALRETTRTSWTLLVGKETLERTASSRATSGVAATSVYSSGPAIATPQVLSGEDFGDETWTWSGGLVLAVT